jgi:integrase
MRCPKFFYLDYERRSSSAARTHPARRRRNCHPLARAADGGSAPIPFDSGNNPIRSGRWPFLAREIMRHYIIPVARKLGITKRIGWHTFRHTYSTLLRSTGAELKIMQELLRHSTIRVTLDTYTQAVTTEKRNAQEAVVALLFREKTQER